MVAIKIMSTCLFLTLLTPTLQCSWERSNQTAINSSEFPCLQSIFGSKSVVPTIRRTNKTKLPQPLPVGAIHIPQTPPTTPTLKPVNTNDTQKLTEDDDLQKYKFSLPEPEMGQNPDDFITVDSSEDELNENELNNKAPTITVTPPMGVNSEASIGLPFPTVMLDTTTQNNDFVSGLIPGFTGDGKGHCETPLAYILRLAKNGQLCAVCKKPHSLEPKITDRIRQALEEGTTNLTSRTTQQTTEWTKFLAEQRAATDAFLKQQEAVTVAFLTQRRNELQATTQTVATVLEIVDNIPGAERCLSDSCIEDGLNCLKRIQREKEKELIAQTNIAQASLEELQNKLLCTLKKEEAEALEEINVIHFLREKLHGTHPVPTSITPLSPRQTYPSITARK